MKLLVIGIDAVSPNLVFNNIDTYPNLKKILKSGSGGSYDGYVYGYGSHDNWVSMYTGLSPQTHGVISGRYGQEEVYPQPKHYAHLEPLWEKLNQHGFSIGFWKGLATSPPVKVEGFMVSGEANFEREGVQESFRTFKPLVNAEDCLLVENYKGDASNVPFPKSPLDYGVEWSELFEQPSLIDSILDNTYFEEGLVYYRQVLEDAYLNVKAAYEQRSTDLFWFYDATFDYLEHFQMHDKDQTVMKQALKYVDNFVGKMLDLMQPDNILFISDHGQRAIIDFFPNCSTEIRREAYGLSANCVISNNNMVMKGRNPGMLSGLHDLKGTMIWSGKDIGLGDVSKGQTVDIYPTILELFNIQVPQDRPGYILPILNKKILNKKHIKKLERMRDVLFVQNCSVSEFNGVINEYYYENRDARITVAIDMKFEEVFKVNYQVCNIIDKQNKKIQLEFIEIYEV